MATLDESDYARIHDIVTSAVQPLQRDLGRHERALYGNGQPGIIRDVEVLKGGKTRERLSLGTIAAAIATVLATIVASIAQTPNK